VVLVVLFIPNWWLWNFCIKFMNLQFCDYFIVRQLLIGWFYMSFYIWKGARRCWDFQWSYWDFSDWDVANFRRLRNYKRKSVEKIWPSKLFILSFLTVIFLNFKPLLFSLLIILSNLVKSCLNHQFFNKKSQ
jgi:hypothetical protein